MAKADYTNPVLLKDAMHIPEMVQLVEDLKTGKIVPCSPFPGMGEAGYTQEQLDASHAFLVSLQAKLLAKKAAGSLDGTTD